MNLERFVDAQDPVYSAVLAELREGEKKTHWMWFVFPQLSGLGSSSTARTYGLAGIDEARAYLAHPVLGARLRECFAILAGLRGVGPYDVFDRDAVKLHSCATLFDIVEPASCFRAVLDRWFGGIPDITTVTLCADRPAEGSAGTPRDQPARNRST